MSVIPLSPKSTETYDKRIKDVEQSMQDLQEDYNNSAADYTPYNTRLVIAETNSSTALNQSTNAFNQSTDALNKVNANDSRINNLFNTPSGKDLELQDLRYDSVNNVLYSSAGERVNSITSQLNDIVTNVRKYGAKGDGSLADKNIIQNMLDTLPEGSILYFPNGVYKLDGITITKCMSILGQSETNTIIKNNSVNPAIYINPTTMNANRYSIKNITIQGNGTQNRGTDATSGHGIQINNSPYWDISARIINHGGHGIYLTGMSWSTTITKCLIGYNKLDGINCIAPSSSEQKNDIDIVDNSITWNGANGVNAWGVNINILQNSIDACGNVGILIDRISVVTAYSCNGLNIKDNYFETNKYGHMQFKTGYNTRINTINALVIMGNYFYSSNNDLDVSATSLIKFIFDPVDISSPTVKNMLFGVNYFLLTNLPTTKYVDFSNGLGVDSIISPHNKTYYINCGLAKIECSKDIVLNGYCTAKGVSWSQIEKSDNVASGTTITFPIPLPSFFNPITIGVWCDTDSTNYAVTFTLKARDKKTMNSYTNLWSTPIATQSGSKLVTTSHVATYGLKSIIDTNSDMILQITITRVVTGTYFNIGNPYIEFN